MWSREAAHDPGDGPTPSPAPLSELGGFAKEEQHVKLGGNSKRGRTGRGGNRKRG